MQASSGLQEWVPLTPSGLRKGSGLSPASLANQSETLPKSPRSLCPASLSDPGESDPGAWLGAWTIQRARGVRAPCPLWAVKGDKCARPGPAGGSAACGTCLCLCQVCILQRAGVVFLESVPERAWENRDLPLCAHPGVCTCYKCVTICM